MEARDRSLGALLGLVAGDRNGGPVRFALRLTESLVERREFDLADILDRYKQWWETGAFDTGPTAAAVLQRVSEGEGLEAAVAAVDRRAGGQTAGVGPAHHSAPLGALTYIPYEQLGRAARQEARLTHQHHLAGWVSAAVCYLIRTLVEGMEWSDALRRVATRLRMEAQSDSPAVQGLKDPLPAAGVSVAHVATSVAELVDEPGGAWGPSREDPLRRGGYAPDVLRAALRFTDRAGSAVEAIDTSLRFAGPANYAPVLVGVLAGARWGADAIPGALLKREASIGESFRKLVAASWA